MKKRFLMMIFALALSIFYCVTPSYVAHAEDVEYSETNPENPTITLITGEIIDIKTGKIVGYDASQPNAGMNISGTVTPAPGDVAQKIEETQKEKAESLEKAINSSDESDESEDAESSGSNASKDKANKDVFSALDNKAEDALVKTLKATNEPIVLYVDVDAVDLKISFDTMKKLKELGKEFYIQMVKQSDTSMTGAYLWHFVPDKLTYAEVNEVDLEVSVHENAAFEDAVTIDFTDTTIPANFIYFAKKSDTEYGIYTSDGTTKLSTIKSDESGMVEFEVPETSLILSSSDIVVDEESKHADKESAEKIKKKVEEKAKSESSKKPLPVWLYVLTGISLISILLNILYFAFMRRSMKRPKEIASDGMTLESTGDEKVGNSDQHVDANNAAEISDGNDITSVYTERPPQENTLSPQDKGEPHIGIYQEVNTKPEEADSDISDTPAL